MSKPTASISSITFSDGQTIELGPKEKLMLVGPNNSGKSLTLREAVRSAESQNGDFQHNKVVKGMTIAKTGTSEVFREYLETNGSYQDNVYRVQEWAIQEGVIKLWDSQPLLW